MISPLDLIADHQCGHSEFQHDRFITIRSGGTLYGCYKQAVHELFDRWRGLRDYYAQRLLAQIDLRELDEKSRGDGYDAERAAVNLELSRHRFDELQKRIGDEEREFTRFYQQAAAMKADVGKLTPERRRELDRDMWTHRVKCMAARDYMTAGRLAPNTLDLFLAFPTDLRQSLAPMIFADDERKSELIGWFLSYQCEIPEPLGLTEPERKGLLECCESSLSPKRLPSSSQPTARLPWVNTPNGWPPANHAENGAV